MEELVKIIEEMDIRFFFIKKSKATAGTHLSVPAVFLRRESLLIC